MTEQCVQTIEAWIENTCEEDDPDTTAVTYSAQLSSESEEKKTLSNDIPLTTTQDSPAKRLRRLSSKLRSLEEEGAIAEEDYIQIMAAGKCAKKSEYIIIHILCLFHLIHNLTHIFHDIYHFTGSSKSMKPPTPTSAPTLIETYNLSSSTVVEIPKDDIAEPISLTLDGKCDSIQDITVIVNIEYPQVGHLSIGLFSPDGKNGTLMNQPSGDSDKSSGDKSDLSKLNSLTFNDSADSSDPDTIGAGADTSEDVPQGTFYSVGNGAKDEFGVTLVGNPNSLSDFKGNKNGEGTWSLFVLNNGKKTGTIHSVELTVECAIAAPPPVCSFCPDGLDDPDIEIPVDEMPTCQDASDFAATLTSTDEDCKSLKLAEPTCCPPPVTTTQATITTPETTTDATTTAITTTPGATTTAVTTTQASVCVVAPKEAAEGCVTDNGLNGCRDPGSSFGPANSQAFDIITAGETYCGSVSTYPRQFGFTFDSDNYVLTVPVRRDFKFELKLTGDTFNANLSVRKLLDESQPCGSSFSVFERDTTSEVEQTELLSIGTYKITVIPNERSGLECGTGKTYSYELKVTDLGP